MNFQNDCPKCTKKGHNPIETQGLKLDHTIFRDVYVKI
jgi:hypothetical protein